jgi:hypothetical protein
MRTRLIEDAWEFIRVTEGFKDTLRDSHDYMTDMLEILAQTRTRYPILAETLLSI